MEFPRGLNYIAKGGKKKGQESLIMLRILKGLDSRSWKWEKNTNNLL